MLDVATARELIRNLVAWRSAYESEGLDILTGPDEQYAIQDIEYFYELTQTVLPVRQRQAIRLCLLNNLTEEETATIMKIDIDNPVAMYATSGLESLIHMMKIGILPSRQKFYADKASKRYFNWDEYIVKVGVSDFITSPIFMEPIPVEELLQLQAS